MSEWKNEGEYIAALVSSLKMEATTQVGTDSSFEGLRVLQKKMGAAAAALESQAKRIAELEAALRYIAAFDDAAASAHLERTGIYSAFDEPGSVAIARAALKETPRE